jgi:phospholipase C
LGNCVIFVTWDDWGGWSDHVELPIKETWTNAHAQRPEDTCPEFEGQPWRYGSRVPCLVISPYANAGHVSSQETSHVSLVRFCEETFGLNPLTTRDGDSNAMSDCFNLEQQPLAPPATDLPQTNP